MTVSGIIEKRNHDISEIKDKYLKKRDRLLLEMQWEIDDVERAYRRDLSIANAPKYKAAA